MVNLVIITNSDHKILNVFNDDFSILGEIKQKKDNRYYSIKVKNKNNLFESGQGLIFLDFTSNEHQIFSYKVINIENNKLLVKFLSAKYLGNYESSKNFENYDNLFIKINDFKINKRINKLKHI
jgi:hypothetical protein